MTPAADMTTDYPHGTTAGFKRGCKGGGECPGGYGQTCAQASVRANSDYRYGKAVAKDREVEFLEAQAASATAPPVKSAKASRAEAQQRKQHRAPGQPLVTDSYDDPTVPDAVVDRAADTAFQPDPSDRIDGWDRTDAIARGVHEDGRPFHAPEPPLPVEPVLGNPTTYPEARCPRAEAHSPHEWTRGLGAYVSEERDTWCPGRLLPAGFEVFDRQARTSEVRAAAQRGRTHESRKVSAQASADAQRDRALATASAEHPLGLKLDGTPRTRPAAGTRLGADGRLYDARPEAVVRAALAAPAPEAPVPVPAPAAVRDYAAEQVAAALAAAAPSTATRAVPGATADDIAAAADAAERAASVLADTDWKAVARSLGRIADAMEKLRGLA